MTDQGSESVSAPRLNSATARITSGCLTRVLVISRPIRLGTTTDQLRGASDSLSNGLYVDSIQETAEFQTGQRTTIFEERENNFAQRAVEV